MDAYDYLVRQRNWSEQTFGPGPRTLGIIEHIKKELAEIQEHPEDLKEWVDVVILALDGAWRSGHTPTQILNALVEKQIVNENRQWPDWRTRSENEAIEHTKSGE